MAVHFSIGRFLSIFLFALLAVAAGTAHYLSRSGPEAETTSASQITVAVPSPAVPNPAMPAERRPDAEPVVASPAADEASAPGGRAAATPLVAVPTDAVALAALPAETMPAGLPPPTAAEAESEVAAEPKFEVEAEPEARAEAEAMIAAAAELEAVSAPAAVQTESVPAVASSVAPSAATGPAAPRRRVTTARLVIEPQRSPVVRDPARSTLRPKNLAPIPKRAPRAAKATKSSIAGASSRAAMLFKNGTEIKIKRDANVYITAPNIPKDDRLLAAYNADRPNGGRVQTRFGEATAVPGLLGIANQAHRAQAGGQGNPVYSLADAMRDAVWRKNTAARLKSLTTAQNACVVGATAKSAPSIGLATNC